MQRDMWPKQAVVGFFALCLAATQAPQAQAADLDQLKTSLNFVPSDVAFYSTGLRNREQFEKLRDSKAHAKVLTLPLVQQGMQMLHAHLKNPPDPQLAQLLEMYKQPENQELVQLFADMLSNEVFTAGDKTFTDFVDLFLKVANSNRFSGLTLQLQGVAPDKIMALGALRTLAKHKDMIVVPDMVIGYKLGSTQAADRQLKRLEAVLTEGFKQAPPNMRQAFKRRQIAGHSYLSLELDASALPWEQIPIKELEQKEGEFAPLMKKLSSLKLHINIGLRDGYLLVALGGSTRLLERLGRGERLVDRPELKKLNQHAGEKLIAIQYSSGDYITRLATGGNDFGDMEESLFTALKSANVTDEQIARMRKDFQAFMQQAASAMPRLGSRSSCSYLTPRGQEGFAYDWSEYPSQDASKPLGLLEHVGGSPLMAIVGRAKSSDPKAMEAMSELMKKAYGYVEELVLPRLEPEQKTKFEQVMRAVTPSLTRINSATAKHLIPALADGQSGLVLDAKLSSNMWHQALQTEKAMPMLEPAILFGVSDAAKLKAAMLEYRAAINELMTKLHELNPEIPDFQIPEPQVTQAGSGTLYSYPIPKEAGVDAQILPTGALSKNLFALTLSHSQAARLQGRSRFSADSKPLGDLGKASAGASYVNFAGLIDALTPWIELGVKTALKQNPGGAPPEDYVMQHVKVGLELLKCFKSYSSRTYLQDKVWITHSESVISDLP